MIDLNQDMLNVHNPLRWTQNRLIDRANRITPFMPTDYFHDGIHEAKYALEFYIFVNSFGFIKPMP